MNALRRPVTLVWWLLGGLWSAQGLARFFTFHNETFDLAFYTRLAWGMAHGSFWEPIVGAHMLGLHVNLVLLPLGLLGRLTGQLPVLLLVAQGFGLAAAVFPIAQLGHRILGGRGSAIAVALFALHPTPSHVASYEFHPSAFAVPALAWLILAVVDRKPRGFFLAALTVLACREDLALVTLLAAATGWWSVKDRAFRRTTRSVAWASVAALVVFVFLFQRLFAPPGNSVALHFGQFGSSPGAALAGMAGQPLALLGIVFRPRNLTYLVWTVGSACFLPILAPRWWLIVLPVLAANLVSAWPTTTELSTHYSLLLVPVWVVSTLEGTAWLQRKTGMRDAWMFPLVTSALTHVVLAQTPLSLSYERQSFLSDEQGSAAAALVSQIPPEASVQAPYRFLPHLAERMDLARVPPPDRNFDMVVLDTSHRERFRGEGSLLRSTEEPVLRDWLAKETFQLIAEEGPFMLFERGRPPRESPVLAPYWRGEAADASRLEEPVSLTACLSLQGAKGVPQRGPRAEAVIELVFVAHGACPADLALRIGTRLRPRRTELLFDGVLSPVHLRAGDHLVSAHGLSSDEATAFRAGRLRVGLVRQSGARPEKRDPVSVALPAPQSVPRDP